MIADHHMHTTARLGRLGFQRHDEFHRGAGMIAAIENVAVDHEMGLAGRPSLLPIDNAALRQGGNERVVITVTVAHGNDPPNTVKAPVVRECRRKKQRGDQGKERQLAHGILLAIARLSLVSVLPANKWRLRSTC